MHPENDSSLAPGANYRPDIDGMRAIAVLSVVVFHAFPTLLPGGFVGVDVFFVISGYLITSIILSDTERGRFSIIDFYGRRIRRIFPVLSLVLLACILTGWHMLLANEYAQLGQHVAAGAGFISNLVLWKESGYFDTASDLKPLLHLWSLGIEEQFYIFWPCILWIAHRNRVHLGWLTLMILLISFASNIYTVEKNPVSDFYLPFCRAWELLIGARLATDNIKTKYLYSFSKRIDKNLMASLGLALIGIPLSMLNNKSIFPGWLALLPTIGTALLIQSKESWINRILLSQKLLVWIGLISYPLYIWHWPILSFARIMENGEPAAIRLGALIIASMLLAFFSYRFVEKYLRHKGNLVAVFLLIFVIFLGLLGWNIHSREGLEFRYRRIINLPTEMRRDFSKWEDKGMHPEGVCSPDFVYPNARICLQSEPNLTPNTIVFGDSHAFHAYWGIARSLPSSSVVKLVGRGGCTFGLYRDNEDCIQTFEKQIDWMTNNTQVKTVFVIHRLVIQNNSTLNDREDYRQRIGNALNRLIQNGKQVYYLHSVPELRFNPRLCTNGLPFGRKSDLTNCEFPLLRELEMQKTNRELVDEFKKQLPTLNIFDPSNVLCPQGKCQAIKDGTVRWMDDNHISESSSYLLGDAIAKAVLVQ